MFPRFILKTFFFFSIIVFLFAPSFVFAAEKTRFFVSPDFDFYQREEIIAVLIKTSPKLYFYVDNEWWLAQGFEEQRNKINSLKELDQEFRNRIYPILTETFGLEPRPGIDGDLRITVLIHPMIEKVGGYFHSGDGFSRVQVPSSNEREMLYLNAFQIESPWLRNILAHEFIHLITFNQKDIIRGVTEEIWLNDLRAEFASTLLGYDDVFEDSLLKQRVKSFLRNPSDSLTEWLAEASDYGVVSLFAQYLNDFYGIEILVDSLLSEKVGIPSINYALEKNGFEQDFHQIFTDWKIALLVNDCEIGPKYCFLNPQLKDLRVVPLTNFLPLIGQGVLSVTHTTTDWSANWYRFIGGHQVLRVEFKGNKEFVFKVPYMIEDVAGNLTIGFLELDEQQRGVIYIPDFNSKNRSFTIMPSAQSKITGFNGREKAFSFSLTASIEKRTPEQEKELIKEIIKQIEFLRELIFQLQAEIALLVARRARLFR